MAGRSREPFFWALFSGGGMLAALVLPMHLFLAAFALPLGWVEPGGPLTTLAWWARLYLLGLAVLSLFHWAHRFRFTLYDGLQLYHLNPVIAALCYGGATLGSLVAAWILWPIG